MRKVWKTSEYHIDNTGERLVTEALQALIDETSQAGGILVLEKGTYLTAPLFLKSGMEFHFEDGAVLRGLPMRQRYR